MFRDREDAGKLLAKKLVQYRGTDSVVLALPRGGVVPGYEVAHALRLPLDIIAVRKVGHPSNPEYALGAIDESGAALFNEAETAAVDPQWLKDETRKQHSEAMRRAKAYRVGKEPLPLAGKTAIIVDDGIATGLTMKLAVQNAQSRGAKRVVAAVPVAPPEAVAALESLGAEVFVLEKPEEFLGAVGAHYERFDQITDAEVIELMRGTQE
jgi:putative phosphoribosyl transferase